MNKRYIKPFCLLLLMVFILSIFALKVLQNFPNSADEYVYLFEANTFASGRLYADPPPMLELFRFFHIIEREGRYFGIFPPGYPILLSIGVIMRIPWIINPLLGAMTIFLIYLIALHLFNRQIAILSCILAFFTPYFILNSASYFSHAACTFFLALLVYSYIKSHGTYRLFWYFMIGASSGYAFNTRYMESVVTIIPIGIILAVKLLRNPKKMLKPCLAIFMGGLIFLGLFMMYNTIIIGDPLQSPSKYYNISVTITFSKHSLNEGFKYFINYITKLFYWTYYLPLVIFPLFFYFFRSKPPFLTPILIVICILNIAGIFLYPMGAGNEYGPRYYYSFYYILPILASYTIDRLLVRKKYIYPIIGIILILNIHSTFKKSTVYHEQIFLRQDLYRTVHEAGLSKAVVFIETPSWDMPPRDLIRNGIKLDGSVIYAHASSPTKQKQLMKHFPTYLPYRYKFVSERKKGRITPITQ